MRDNINKKENDSMEFNEMMLKEELKIIDEMFKIGEIETFKKKTTGMLTGLGLGMIAGYAIFKAIVERKGTQSEVIVEEVK